MNPTPVPNTNATDETAISASAPTGAPAAGETTGIAGAADVTVVRAAPSAVTVTDKPDPTNFGKYALLGEIARGGMGVVYRARQHGLDRTVALKMILGDGIGHETAQRFLQEARAAAALDHPNVVPIYDIGEIDTRPYFTMALIDGPNLRGHVEALGVVAIPTAVALFAQIVAGVAHAHQAGIIHRDLKPANVLIDKDGRPRVTDFGLAKRATVDSALTATGQVVGTPQYMAPEQARDSKDVGPPADVYALGAILYFVLTGRPVFVGESFTDLLIKVVQDAPVPPSHYRADIPPELEALCLKCLAKTPGERYADAEALGAALAPIADQHMPSAGGFSSSLARIGLSRPSTPTVGTVTSLPDLTPTMNTGPAFANAPSVGAASLPAFDAPEQPAPNRKPLVFGLVAVAVLLVGVIGFLATRGNKTDEVAKQDPPAPVEKAAVGPPGLLPPPPFPPPLLPPVLPVAKVDVLAKTGWGAVGKPDFGLKVELGEKPDAGGVYQLTAGKPMTLGLTAEQDCRVFVWLIEPDGSVTQLFPNADDPDNRLFAGKARTVPGNDRYVLETTTTAGEGVDRLRVLAYTGPEQPALPAGEKQGRFEVFVSKRGHDLAASVTDFAATRGVVIKKVDAKRPGAPHPSDDGPKTLSEVELRFRVGK